MDINLYSSWVTKLKNGNFNMNLEYNPGIYEFSGPPYETKIKHKPKNAKERALAAQARWLIGCIEKAKKNPVK